MERDKYIDDLKDIKDLMNRSSKFISLSGWSGISIGIVALIAAFIAHLKIKNWYTLNSFDGIINGKAIDALKEDLLIIAAITLILSLGFGIIFTINKSKRINQKLWSKQSKTLLINLLIPLIIGGILCLLFIQKGNYGVVAPLTLLFYGLALINASSYTIGEIKSLGILNCILGLIGVYQIGIGIILWGIGFGVLHIIYGILMKIKHN